MRREKTDGSSRAEVCLGVDASIWTLGCYPSRQCPRRSRLFHQLFKCNIHRRHDEQENQARKCHQTFLCRDPSPDRDDHGAAGPPGLESLPGAEKRKLAGEGTVLQGTKAPKPGNTCHVTLLYPKAVNSSDPSQNQQNRPRKVCFSFNNDLRTDTVD